MTSSLYRPVHPLAPPYGEVDPAFLVRSSDPAGTTRAAHSPRPAAVVATRTSRSRCAEPFRRSARRPAGRNACAARTTQRSCVRLRRVDVSLRDPIDESAFPREVHALREVGGSKLPRDANASTPSRPGATRNDPPSVPHRSANSGIVDEPMLRAAPSHRDEHASHTAPASRHDDQSVQARSATHRPDHREQTENPSRARRPAARSAARSAESASWSRHVEHRPASTVVASRAPPSTAVVAYRERVENGSSTTRGEAPQGANRPTGQGAPRRTSASEDDDGASRPGRESERPLVIALGLVVAARGCRPCPVASRWLGGGAAPSGVGSVMSRDSASRRGSVGDDVQVPRGSWRKAGM